MGGVFDGAAGRRSRTEWSSCPPGFSEDEFADDMGEDGAPLDQLILRAREVCAAERDALESYLVDAYSNTKASFESLRAMIQYVCPDRMDEADHAEIAAKVDN